jgi:ElaB/YqjD/DUF883 family membrane-anchored ribosome-binding protein
MFNFNSTEISDALDKRIAELLEELDTLTGSEDNYTKTTANLAKLLELKNQLLKTSNEATKIQNDRTKIEYDNLSATEETILNQRKVKLEEDAFAAAQQKERSWKPTPDAVVGAAASVFGILMVLHYEKVGVVTSKALGFIGKMK